MIIDLIQHFDTEAVIVSRNYLGSINHTLLTFEVLKQRGVTITGIIFNGEENKETESYILKFTGVPLLGRVNLEESVDKEMIRKYAIQFEQIYK